MSPSGFRIVPGASLGLALSWGARVGRSPYVLALSRARGLSDKRRRANESRGDRAVNREDRDPHQTQPSQNSQNKAGARKQYVRSAGA